jgi:hypothetical protein
MISENPILQHERVLNRDFITLTVYINDQKLIGLLVILRQIYIFLMHAGYHFLLEVQTRPYMHHQLFPPFNDKKSGYAVNKHVYFRLFEILIKLIFNTRRIIVISIK